MSNLNFHNYFLSLEKRFIELSEYIEITEDNFNVYSNYITLLLITTCSEFEVVSKELSKILNDHPKNIFNIYNCFKKEGYKNILEESVFLDLYKIDIQPFEKWNEENVPFWWEAYNGVKHNRASEYKKGNLKTLIYALSALSIVNHYFIWVKEYDTKSKNAPVMQMSGIPEIFKVSNVQYYGPVDGSDFFDI